MFRKNKLSYAVSAALGATIIAGPASAAIEEIIVTASKRAESAQDVPISVQALGGDSLRDLKIETFDKYVEFLPNVVSAGNGPGKKEVYIRGSAGEQSSVTVGPAQGSAPGVALYLDEQPISFGSRNLDIYAVDLERIEVLSGPQGTLFGASSQSGTVRLITNKPKQGKVEGGFNAKQSFTSGGADSTAVDAYLNLPLSEKLAARVAIYNDNQGGWIDNVQSIFTPSPEVIDRNQLGGFGPRLTSNGSDIRVATPGTDGGVGLQSANNQLLVQDDWNAAQYRGARLGLAYDINDDWSVLVQHTEQTLETTGSFLTDPSLGDNDRSAKFSPERNRDDFGLTTWTLEGRIANLDVIYTGGRISRDIDSVIDYTHYNNGGGYISYYLCGGNVYDATDPVPCFDPTKQYTDRSTNDRTTHEFRITSDADNRFRFIAGGYFNSFETTHIGEFQYLSTEEAFRDAEAAYYNRAPEPGFFLGNTTISNNGVNVAGTVTNGPRGPNTVFFNDFTRTEDEFAFFGEIAFDFTDKLSARISGRYYDLDSQLQGASNFSFGCRYGLEGFGLSGTASNGGCDGDAFSNDVSTRLDLLGSVDLTGVPTDLRTQINTALGVDIDTLSRRNSEIDRFSAAQVTAVQNVLSAHPSLLAIFNARSPSGTRDFFRGGGSNTDLVIALAEGRFDPSLIEPDGSTNESDFIFKATIDYKIDDNNLLFATYSEGYRPATQNRNAGRLASRQAPEVSTNPFFGFYVPAAAVTDELTNFEVGYKGDVSDSFRINATAYWSTIDNLQVSRFDPSNVAFLVFVENVGDADIFGIDADFQWAVSDALTLTGAFSYLDTELSRVNPQLNNVAVPVGSDLPLASDFSGNLRARYDFSLDSYDADAYVTASVNYRGKSAAGIAGSARFFEDTLFLQSGRSSGLEIQDEGGVFLSGSDAAGNPLSFTNSRYVNPSATTFNVAFGVEKDSWGAELFIDNLSDEEASIVQVAGKFTPEVTNQRPRTVGLRFSYFFE